MSNVQWFKNLMHEQRNNTHTVAEMETYTSGINSMMRDKNYDLLGTLLFASSLNVSRFSTEIILMLMKTVSPVKELLPDADTSLGRYKSELHERYKARGDGYVDMLLEGIK